MEEHCLFSIIIQLFKERDPCLKDLTKRPSGGQQKEEKELRWGSTGKESVLCLNRSNKGSGKKKAIYIS